MKRKFLITALIFLTGALSHAQDLDIKPSQQAQGLLESKNAMVDHATGLFHYKVPLYEIKSGDFTLPISLNYIAKGVKVNDESGLIGYNWTLNTGGVVTRTVRGGIADEDSNGIAMKPLSVNPTISEIEEINKRERDGESDIFTANFNGKAINFIIKYDNINNKIICEPLERTNVKIECNFDSNEINNWIVTDEDGNKYFFAQKEWTTNVNREGNVGLNSLNNKKYISSWYINKIEPQNSSSITYSYIEKVNSYEGRNKQDSIDVKELFFYSHLIYYYGNPIFKYPFDFSKYREQFNENIDKAISYLNEDINALQLSKKLPSTIAEMNSCLYMKNPWNELVDQKVKTDIQIMGILTDFLAIYELSDEAMNTLNELAKICRSNGSSMAEACINSAIKLFNDCISEVIISHENEQLHGSAYSTCTPLLKKIKYGDKIITFSYIKKSVNRYELDKIQLCDIYKQNIKKIKIDINENMKISYLDNNNMEYEKIIFDYYKKFNSNTISDCWGYPKKNDLTENLKYGMNVDINNAKNLSLQKITTSKGSIIELNYESNRYKDSFNHNVIFDTGGIRISSVIIRDTETYTSNTIKYHYPVAGVYINKDCTNEARVNYLGFSDDIKYNHILNDENTYISYGNNGLYYEYVEEEFVGKGFNTYEFNVVDGSVKGKIFPFWLCGLPLAKATYDKEYNLKKVIQYSYLEAPNSTFQFSYDFSKKIPQIRAYEYYINKNKIKDYYKYQDSIFAEKGKYVNLTNKIYIPNIEPRTNAILPTQDYEIYYGGKVLLEREIEYTFENSNSGKLDRMDLYKISPNFIDIEYSYGNLSQSVHPTKIVKSFSDGVSEIDIIKRITEISDGADPVISKMKNNNLYNKIIKNEKQIKKRATSDYYLVQENVYKYHDTTMNDRNYITLNKIYTCDLKDIASRNPESVDSRLFNYGISNYQVTNIKCKYDINGMLSTHLEDIKSKKFTQNDSGNGNVILKSLNCNYNSIDAVDYNRLNSTTDSETLKYETFFNAFKTFYTKYSLLDLNNASSKFKLYSYTAAYRNIIKIIKNIVATDEKLSYNEFKVLLSTVDTNNFNEFEINLISELPNICPNNISFKNDIYNLLDQSYLLKNIDLNIYCNMDMYDVANIKTKKPIEIFNVNSNKNYKLFLLGKGSIPAMTCYILHSDEYAYIEIEHQFSQYPKLYVYDINLSTYNNITSLDIEVPQGNNIYYMALVPEDAEFEAISYNNDGTVFCKFNQAGQLERYEYDAAGRVTKIYDAENNLLKEFKYNVVL